MVAVTMHDLECGELLLPSDEIPADPADAADHCAAADEALHCRGFMRTGPWQALANGDWTAKIEADWGGGPWHDTGLATPLLRRRRVVMPRIQWK